MSEPVIARGLAELGGILERLGARRVLVVSGPSERFLERVRPAFGARPVAVFSGARRHVPEAVLAAAETALRDSGADTLVAVGGGAAIGVAKALRLAHELRFVAVPTTYAGSERTSLYGITSSAGKKTGRDARVLPDAVVYELELTRGMPKILSVQSLMNALAHPIGSLGTRSLSGEPERVAFSAIQTLVPALEALSTDPDDRAAREAALEGAGLAARAIEAGTPGAHHRLAHALGGLFDLDHGGLHSVLLPHGVHELRAAEPDVLGAIESRLGTTDLEAKLFDCLARAGAPTSLKELGAGWEKLDALLPTLPSESRRAVRNAYHGRRPSLDARHEDVGMSEPAAVYGPPLDRARAVVVALHGRGSTAENVLGRVREIVGSDPTVAVLAPQAFDNEWYHGRNFERRTKLGDRLEASVRDVSRLLDRAAAAVSPLRVVLFGFSQGACLATEVFTRRSERLGGLLVLSGAVIGEPDEDRPPGEGARGTLVVVGASEGDPWVNPADIERTALLLERAGCVVTRRFVPGAVHAVHDVHREEAHRILAGIRV